MKRSSSFWTTESVIFFRLLMAEMLDMSVARTCVGVVGRPVWFRFAVSSVAAECAGAGLYHGLPSANAPKIRAPAPMNIPTTSTGVQIVRECEAGGELSASVNAPMPEKATTKNPTRNTIDSTVWAFISGDLSV